MNDKKRTIGYIFLHTVVMQVIVLFVFLSVAVIAYYANKYSSGALFFVGAISFIAMMFIFMSVTIFMKSYGVPLLSPSGKERDYSIYGSSDTKKIEYYYGRKNVITGERPIYVREIPAKNGGVLLVLGIPAIWIGLTGIFKFLIEVIRVSISDKRLQAWDESIDYLKYKIEQEKSPVAFFATPIVSSAIMLITVLICLPIIISTVHLYNPSHLEFKIDEKENYVDKYGNGEIFFYGSVENAGSKKIKQIEGIVYFKDEHGDLLHSMKIVLKPALAAGNQQKEYLDSGEEWKFSLNIRLYKDAAEYELWNTEFDDLEITVEITEVCYYRDKFVDFKNKSFIIKPIE